MITAPKVSVIVPVYNTARYLDRCMDTLLNQTLREIEIILVDDESPDSAPQMCDEYAKKDPRVKVIHKKNAGLGFARNSGLEIANGEYVAFVDSDDYVKHTMYEELYGLAASENCDAVLSNFSRVDTRGKIVDFMEFVGIQRYETSTGARSLLMEMIGSEPSCPLDRRYAMSVWRGVYSRILIVGNAIEFPSERQFICEDILFHIRFLSRAVRVLGVETCNYFYCQNAASLTQTYREDRFEKIKVMLDGVIDVCTELNPFSASEIRQRAYRMFIGDVRYLCLSFKNSPSDIRRICEDSKFMDVIGEYPHRQLPAMHRLFLFLVITRLYCAIYSMAVVRRMARDW